MPTRLRKTRKLRGSRTCGYGRVGQHRKSGSRGGKGKAGLKKHKWTWTVKYAPDHFGKAGFKPPKKAPIKSWINVGQLDEIYDKLMKECKIERKEDKTLIDLIELGYDRLLGNGEIKGRYHIVARSFTKSAKDKIEKAGGSITTR
ncbi:MAG: 50S ribosomal protein L15 [Candidatus Methylarchaceae archaeon HK02M1]|nr:50S ribosomal protein L15 [Candidatus Methylarchaceae archaeon HK01M]MCP8312222.1 50S ribosomal protein L15 [Candidatus Methylarchaceae archaeon HK02M1]